MGKVAVTYRLLPSDVEVDFKSLKHSIEYTLGEKLRAVEEVPIAFGLKALRIMVVLDDETGRPEDVESSLAALKGVQSIETEEVTLI